MKQTGTGVAVRPQRGRRGPQTIKTHVRITIALDVAVNGGTVAITDGQGNTAEVTATDIQATNGVVHAIDSVLLPPSN